MPLYQPTGSQNNWREHYMLYNWLLAVCRGNYCMRMWTKHINILEFLIGLVDEVPSWRVELWVTPKSALRNLIWFMAQLLVHRPPFCSWPRLWKHVCKYATAEEMYLNDSEVWIFVSAFQGWVKVPQPGQCCGTCKKTSCLLHVPGLTTVTLNVSIVHQTREFTTLWSKLLYLPVNFFLHSQQDSQTFTPPNDKCAKYTCSKKNGDFITVKQVTKCPAFNPQNCVPVSTI